MNGPKQWVLIASILIFCSCGAPRTSNAQQFGTQRPGNPFLGPGTRSGFKFGAGGPFGGRLRGYGTSYNSFAAENPLPPVWLYDNVRRAPTYNEYSQYMNSHFPKYNGGFHASFFQNTGLPPGDIGPRGNGVFSTPW